MSSPRSKPKINYASEEGAAILAQRIMQYWHGLGHRNVLAWPERIELPAEDRKRQPCYTVRTNLVSGLPPPCRT